MDNLKTIFAKKLLKLRTDAGMTQSELGDKLSYSDKTISKWERGEAIPDAAVLKKISRIFRISVDNLLDNDNAASETDAPQNSGATVNRNAIARTAIVGIWTLALLIFVILWIFDIIFWMALVYAVPVSLITLLVFNSIWHGGKGNFWIVSGLVLSVILVVYLAVLPWKNPWQLFLMAVPAELLVYCCFRLKSRKK